MKFDYDKENDTLFIFKGIKAKGSINIGDFIIDFSHDGKVSSLEIMNASKILSRISRIAITKELLGRIKEAVIRAEYKGDAVYVFYMIRLESVEKPIENLLPVPIPVPVSK